jgi:hypothetical protein
VALEVDSLCTPGKFGSAASTKTGFCSQPKRQPLWWRFLNGKQTPNSVNFRSDQD